MQYQALFPLIYISSPFCCNCIETHLGPIKCSGLASELSTAERCLTIFIYPQTQQNPQRKIHNLILPSSWILSITSTNMNHLDPNNVYTLTWAYHSGGFASSVLHNRHTRDARAPTYNLTVWNTPQLQWATALQLIFSLLLQHISHWTLLICQTSRHWAFLECALPDVLAHHPGMQTCG